MLKRVISAGLLAGLFAGLAIAILQNFTTTPLILEAEAFEEAGQHAAAATFIAPAVFRLEAPSLLYVHGDAGHGGEAAAGSVWAPQEGFERIAFTSAATIATSIGFALLLLGGLLLSGEEINERTAMIWAAGGFVSTGLAPALGLPPELPGMQAADLVDRQSWWLLTATTTAFALFLMLMYEDWRLRALGVLVLLAPHLVGAPHAEGIEVGRVPAELAARFAATSLAVHAALWIATGFAVGQVWRMLSGVRAPTLAAEG